jgi:undecaprenyl-diphosphatase
VREAVALGLLHGPAELLPVSSSGHAAALPWLLDWEVARASAARRKELEVALHAGSAAALLLGLPFAVPRPALLGPSLLPPVLAGALFERAIEERLAGPRALAWGLLAGAAALAAADRTRGRRRAAAAGWVDGVWLGAAQAAALVPGVSRNGATLSAARARGFARRDASDLSWQVATPVLAGAAALKAWRVARSREAQRAALPLAAGALAAFGSTLGAVRLLGLRRERPLWPWAAERAALAAAVLAVGENRGRW